jgi:hypothetical protein
MHKVGLISLWMVLLLSALLPMSAQSNEVRLTLERTACFGACPMYRMTLYADGTVVYEGDRFVEVTGKQTINIGAETVDKLVGIFESAGYFDWQDEYTRN